MVDANKMMPSICLDRILTTVASNNRLHMNHACNSKLADILYDNIDDGDDSSKLI